jgi:hypothetical protein
MNQSAINPMVLTLATVAALNQVGQASFQGISVSQHSQVTINNIPRTVYRVYAYFSSPTDSLTGWGANTSTSPIHIYTGPCTGNAFYQGGAFGSNHAPSEDSIATTPNVQWDTFATIGVNIAEQGVPIDQTLFSSPFPDFINGNDLTAANAMVYVLGTPPQARADFAGDGDPQLRVLMMQLTTRVGDFPYGSIGFLNWKDANGTSHQMNGPIELGHILEQGRCCYPTGECVITQFSGCVQHNGTMICASCESCAMTCVPDVVPAPGNGMVDVDDLTAVILAWGSCSYPCPADVSPMFGNGMVDIDDLVTVITGWGPCH